MTVPGLQKRHTGGTTMRSHHNGRPNIKNNSKKKKKKIEGMLGVDNNFTNKNLQKDKVNPNKALQNAHIQPNRLMDR